MQQANISVSTLKCDPYDDSVTLDDLDSKIKDNSANIAINTDNSNDDSVTLDDLDSKIKDNSANIAINTDNNIDDSVTLDELDSQLMELKNTPQAGSVWFDVTR